MTPPAAIEVIEQYLRQGEPLLAYNAVQDALRVQPGDIRLRQLQALAIARSGDIERANVLLAELAGEGHADAETLGMLARTHKDLALCADSHDRCASHLEEAFRIYEQAYREAMARGGAAQAWYTGINAATIAVLQGEFDTARRLAADVRALCGAAKPAEGERDDYWRVATLGEAALILGEASESAAHYARAASLATGSVGHLSSTRRQAALLARRLPGSHDWIARVLPIPPVLAFADDSTGAPGEAAAQSPLEERALTDAVRARLLARRPAAAYGSALRAFDILCLEVLQSIGIETHVVLPFPAEECHRVRQESGEDPWQERADRALAAADSVTVASEHRARGSEASLHYANAILTGMALLRAEMLQTNVYALVRRDQAHAAGAVRSDWVSPVPLWLSRQIELTPIDRTVRVRARAHTDRPSPPAAAAARLPAGFTHEIRAMLFADAVGYSALSEDQTPHFVTEFLGAVADLNARSADRPEHVETTGDGLYMVFRDVGSAGRYALQLQRVVRGTDWAARGLPRGLSIRVALHAGPVYRGQNPVTGQPLYTGPHTSRTARIEPITPPGQVYASAAFAAMAAAGDATGLTLQYVGRMALAKGYGQLGLYHVVEGRGAGPRDALKPGWRDAAAR